MWPEVYIHCFDLNRPLNIGLNYLDALEKKRYQRYRFKLQKQYFLRSRYYFKTQLAHYLGCEPQSICFQINAQGKPYLHGIQFNWSHSRGLAVLAVSCIPVGIDLEQAEQTLSPALQKRFKLKSSRDWTAWEACHKLYGIGLWRRLPSDQNHFHHFIPRTGFIACLATQEPVIVRQAGFGLQFNFGLDC